jgi:hypothetical protein
MKSIFRVAATTPYVMAGGVGVCVRGGMKSIFRVAATTPYAMAGGVGMCVTGGMKSISTNTSYPAGNNAFEGL